MSVTSDSQQWLVLFTFLQIYSSDIFTLGDFFEDQPQIAKIALNYL